MRRLAVIGLALFSAATSSILAGCGDNLAKGTGAVGGSGGASSGGRGGGGGASGGAAGGTAGGTAGATATGGRGGTAGSAGAGGGTGGVGGTAGGGSGGVAGGTAGVGATGGAGGTGGSIGGAGGSIGGAGGSTGGTGGSAGPVLTFVTPVAGSKLCAVGNTANGCVPDTNLASPGWQNSITVRVTSGGSPVTTGTVSFVINSGTPQTATVDTSGNATLSGATVPEGNAVPVTASITVGGNLVMVTSTFQVDTLPPSAIATVAAAVMDRRQVSFALSWTAPADQGNVPITSYNIHVKTNDPTTMNPCAIDVATVPFTGTIAAPGANQTFTIPGLFIETPYCFTVAGVDALGNNGTLGMSASIAARFNLTVLTPPTGGPSNERFGITVEGTGDYNGDMLSDVVVGSFNTVKAYLFLGSATFAAAAPTTVFTGANNNFGFALSPIGDIDGDGRTDLAISSPVAGTGKVFIFKGRATWPAALAETDADYVINTDASYMGGIFGSSVTPLGDFNRDGAPDFAIGSYQYSSGRGRVVIVLGKATGFASITLPDPVNTIVIDGDAALPKGLFGYSVLGLGPFYSGAGNTLIVSGIGTTGQTGSTGQLYAFRGQTGTAGAIAIASADAVKVGPAANARIGYQLTSLGPIVSTTVPGVGYAAPFYASTLPTANGHGYLCAGDPTAGPFGGMSWDVYDSAAASSADAFGSVLFGGGLPGTNQAVSIIGDSKPDVGIMPSKEAGGTASIYILNGASLASKPSPLNVTTGADVKVVLPIGWAGTSASGRGLVKDINGDGYGDFAVGELAPTIAGRVAVYW